MTEQRIATLLIFLFFVIVSFVGALMFVFKVNVGGPVVGIGLFGAACTTPFVLKKEKPEQTIPDTFT